MEEPKLLSGKAKDIEKMIVSLYRTVGRMDGLHPKSTEVFAYLRFYEQLSQEQLKELTGFALSTISAILRTFLQTGIIDREMIPGSHKNLYKLRKEWVWITYRTWTEIIDDLELLDRYIVSIQDDLQKLWNESPGISKFLHRRLNGIRNYIEAQRRAITHEKRFAFFDESTSDIIPLEQKIDIPFDTSEWESKIMEKLGFFRGNPIAYRIFCKFIIYRSLDQDAVIGRTGFSRSTISRYLRKALEGDFIHVVPREHQTPRIYYLDSLTACILSGIRETDGYAFSQIPILQDVLQSLQSDHGSSSKETDFLIAKCKETIDLLERFKQRTRYFRKAHDEFTEFLNECMQ